jgi:hypothetical protein
MALVRRNTAEEECQAIPRGPGQTSMGRARTQPYLTSSVALWNIYGGKEVSQVR